jgi:hypothetical protein
MLHEPLSISIRTLALCLNAQQVVQLRLVKLLFGGVDALEEFVDMVFEKVFASADLSLALAQGHTTDVMLSNLHKVVATNLARLSRRNAV